MKKTFSYLAMTSCFVLSTTLAHADTDSHHGKMGGKVQDKMFKMMDENSDGMVTSDEFNTFNSKKFKELDVNGNGQITLEEMKTGYKKMMNDSGRNKMDDSTHDNMDESVQNRMDDSDVQNRRMSQAYKDNPNRSSETRSAGGSGDSCCWTPQNSGANKSGKQMDDKD